MIYMYHVQYNLVHLLPSNIRLPTIRNIGEPWPKGTALAWHACGASFQSHWGQQFVQPSLSEETINQDPNTPLPTTHALICEKDPGIQPKEFP